MKEKTRVRRVLIVGANPAAIAAATKLGEMGIPVTLLDEAADINGSLGEARFRWPSGLPSNFALRPGLLRLMRNPQVEVRTSTELSGIKRIAQGFRATLVRNPTYIDPDRCISCGRCVEACPVELQDGGKPILGTGRWALPGGYTIDKRRAAGCTEGCPLGVNVQGYVALTRAGKYREALDLIRRDNVLPGVCGRICTHPCELKCRRREVDSPLAIRDVKRFLADKERERGDRPSLATDSPPERAERVCIVGSGPAGLAAAADLARMGYPVTIKEKMAQAGGLLRYGIGPYRLPREVLGDEIAAIESLGVRIETDASVSLPQDLASLKEQFDAVLVATGSWQDHVLGVPGEDLPGVYGCLELLKEIYDGNTPELPEDVAVIGDGNSAMDLARALTRLGCKVTVVSWFPRDLIPAAPEEVQDALEEGVEIVESAQVVGFEGKNRALFALRLAPTRPGPPDANGIPWPVIIERGGEFLHEFKCAVVAIGQKHEPLGIEGPGVYIAGDAARGPSSVVEAMGSGRDAVRAIHEYLSGDVCVPGIACHRPGQRDYPEIPESLPLAERACAACLEPDARARDFREVVSALDDEHAQMEAERCLMCGVCSECFQCVEACGPIGAVRLDDEPTEEVVQAGVVILTDPRWAGLTRGTDVLRAYPRRGRDPHVITSTVRGFAAAGQAMSLLGMDDLRRPLMDFGWSPPDVSLAPEVRIGLFLCRCNDSLGWDDRIETMVAGYARRPSVEHAEIVNSMCQPDAVEGIIKTIHQKNLTRVLLASCVCCPLNFICGSCTDQRSLLKSLLFSGTGVNRAMFETCNVRGEALSWFRVDREQALTRLEGLLERSLLRAARLISMPLPHRLFNFTTVVIGDSEAARICAEILAVIGLAVYHIGGPRAPLKIPGPAQEGVQVWQGSRLLGIRGQLGNFNVLFEYDGETREVRAGAVVYGDKSKHGRLPYSPSADQPRREVETVAQQSDVPGIPFIMPGATSIAGLFLAQPPGLRISDSVKGYAAAALAACVSRRQARQYKGFTVVVNEQLCRHCGRCVQACPYQAVAFQPNALGLWKAVVDEALCKGCGNCISACPTGAADSPYRNQKHLENMLAEILAS